jgi:hypothetical protein
MAPVKKRDRKAKAKAAKLPKSNIQSRKSLPRAAQAVKKPEFEVQVSKKSQDLSKKKPPSEFFYAEIEERIRSAVTEFELRNLVK